MVISNHNSFRSECCLIKLLTYILFEKNINIIVLEMASPGNQHCVNSIGTLSNPILPYFSSVHEMWMLLEPHRSKEQKMPANAEPRRHVVVFEMPRRSYVIKSISTGASTSTWSATSCARCRLWLWRFLPRVWSVQETIRTRSGGRGGGGIL